MRPILTALAALALLASPVAGQVYFATDHEAGDGYDDWREGQFKPDKPSQGFDFSTGGAIHEVVEFNGNRVLRCYLPDADDGNKQAVRIFRRLTQDGELLPAEAWYSFWFFLPEIYQAQDSVDGATLIGPAQWKGKSIDGGASLPMWSYNFGRDTHNGVDVQEWWIWSKVDGSRGTHSPDAQTSYPVGQWVHHETFFKASQGTDGIVEVWIDGERKYSYVGRTVRPEIDNPKLHWSLYLKSQGVEGGTLEMLVDNVVISASRTGPVDHPEDGGTDDGGGDDGGPNGDPPPHVPDHVLERMAALEQAVRDMQEQIAQLTLMVAGLDASNTELRQMVEQQGNSIKAQRLTVEQHAVLIEAMRLRQEAAGKALAD